MTVNNHESKLKGAGGKAGASDASERDRAKAEARRVWIMRGLVTPFLGLLAVTCFALGLLNATIWKPSRQITATASTGGSQYVVTDPGVLPLVDRQATLTVTSSASDEVCIALGSGKDINGWVSGSPYVRVTGLSSWSGLSTQAMSAKSSGKASGQSDAAKVAFKDSDMWTQVECGKGTATMKTDVDSASSTMALIDLGKSGSASVSLHWVRQTLPDFAVPLYFAGGLLAVMAVLTASLFAMPPHKRRKRVVASAAAAIESEEVSIGEAIAGSWSKIKPKSPSSGRSRHGRRRHASHRSGETGSIAPVVESASAETAETSETVVSQPTIVDPSSRNLVAEVAQTHGADAAKSDLEPHESDVEPASADDGNAMVDDAATKSDAPVDTDDTADTPQPDDDAATSVITPEELQAYFARFAQESGAAANVGGADTAAGASAETGSDANENAGVAQDDAASTANDGTGDDPADDDDANAVANDGNADDDAHDETNDDADDGEEVDRQ
ncbi:hypothetical protein [Bifidobacterium simiiventris]|uniref:hypothetical protein n=1 Tax=Bifidobacterium simiiventris TaxID=2834434 RepID=UPI001F0A4B01|nr:MULTISPECIES: hypothetical protein [Bifidobacterium]